MNLGKLLNQVDLSMTKLGKKKSALAAELPVLAELNDDNEINVAAIILYDGASKVKKTHVRLCDSVDTLVRLAVLEYEIKADDIHKKIIPLAGCDTFDLEVAAENY